MRHKIAISVFAAFLLCSCAPNGGFPKLDNKGKTGVVAHRGFWKSEAARMAENSLSALKAAGSEAFWGCELDVHLTGDGVVMVNHDGRVDSLLIWENPYNAFSAFLLPDGSIRPTFDEFVACARKSARKTMLVIEIKPQPTADQEDVLIDKTIEILKDNGMYSPKRVGFISFSRHSCVRIAGVAPQFVNQYLGGDVEPSLLAEEGVNGIDYHYSVFLAHPEWVAEAHDLGMSVNAWTVNDEENIGAMMALGVDQITTNEPLLVRELLGDKEWRK